MAKKIMSVFDFFVWGPAWSPDNAMEAANSMLVVLHPAHHFWEELGPNGHFILSNLF